MLKGETDHIALLEKELQQTETLQQQVTPSSGSEQLSDAQFTRGQMINNINNLESKIQEEEKNHTPIDSPRG